MDWSGLKHVKKINIIMIRLPANTTHIMQSFDQFVNKRFQKTVRSGRRGKRKDSIDKNVDKENLRCGGGRSVVRKLQSDLYSSLDDRQVA